MADPSGGGTVKEPAASTYMPRWAQHGWLLALIWHPQSNEAACSQSTAPQLLWVGFPQRIRGVLCGRVVAVPMVIALWKEPDCIL